MILAGILMIIGAFIMQKADAGRLDLSSYVPGYMIGFIMILFGF